MRHRLELLQRRSTHALAGRIGSHQIGELPFELQKFAEETVVLGIGDFGTIEDVVAVIVVVDQLA